MSALADLLAFQRETEALAQVAERLGWDQETVMPRGAYAQRGEETAALEGVLHARRTDPRIGEWLAALDTARLAPAEAAQVQRIRRAHERQMRVPLRLATALARTTSMAQGLWADARAREDVAGFLPTLSEVVALKREEGQALAAGGDPYDALMEDYEPGATGEETAALFGRMRPRLVALREAILASDRSAPTLSGRFDEATQMTLAAELAGVFGYDWGRGRLDKAVHPFSSGSGQDVRITTRTDPADPLNCIYSTIHETGHAVYEQTVDPAYLLTAIGHGASMGVHESQSRIFENQLGRSSAFTGWLSGRMVELFGDNAPSDPAEFDRAVNRVHPGFIRTEADEVHYNLHIMLRFDLERALIRGEMEAADLEEAWNARFARDFGQQITRPSQGVLQDVHWPVGLFGYFPTYALGNVYAGCLHSAMRRDLPQLDGDLERGDLAAALHWLKEAVQRHGGLYEPRDLIARATGEPPSEGPLLDYLEAKFGRLYDL
ncbi:peptidase M32 [Haematobacter missouriensis]|uniref:Metal-dependent carboxypeptidase n=1 Tax=Haematobacter missouriensis TaxID=366616 RepID=A0ABX4A0J5_9RHOB|nr:carboxypeptidase M32 [Haematobacter missouriensis]KFI33092.1 peptidase M32 [Haematobacter missouriensis]OWJ79802.1 carboxypeptidase M32 [Haematobacter missouriensis]